MIKNFREGIVNPRIVWITILVCVSILVSGYILLQHEENFKNNMKTKFLNYIQTYISQTVDTTRKWLLAQALMISKNACVEKSYREGNPEILKKAFKPFWEKLHKEYNIEEMHFFKYPQINWIAFATMDVRPCKANVRKDILWIETAFRPDCYFYVCKRFPGLRASYPITIDGKVVGALSFGIHIETLRNILQKSTDAHIFYLLNKEILKKNLSLKSYKKLVEKASLEDEKLLYFHTKRRFEREALEKRKFEIGHEVFLFYPMYDIHGNFIGYIGASKNFKEIFVHMNQTSLLILGTFGFIFVVILGLTLGQVFYLSKQGKEVLYLLELLERRRFSDIERYFRTSKPTKDTYDLIKKAIYRIALTLKEYIDLLNEKLEETSRKVFKDALTGVNNRYTVEQLEEQIEKAGKDLKFSVVMMDIDHFKKINDTYGHDVGDFVLKRLAEEVRKVIRDSDTLVRYGGEEFLIYLPNTSKEDAFKLAERIRKHIEKIDLCPNGKKLSITVSLGVAERENGEPLCDVIKKADEALYKAKELGRNRVEG
ncbi:MAG: diguanylate cyclase [Desulfurobacteriaceae bacterium]